MFRSWKLADSWWQPPHPWLLARCFTPSFCHFCNLIPFWIQEALNSAPRQCFFECGHCPLSFLLFVLLVIASLPLQMTRICEKTLLCCVESIESHSTFSCCLIAVVAQIELRLTPNACRTLIVLKTNFVCSCFLKVYSIFFFPFSENHLGRY